MPVNEVIPSGPDGLGTQSAEGAIKRLRFTHDAMCDILIENPAVTNRQLASSFGYSEQWISRVLCSDVFQARLAARKEKLVDPILVAGVEERLRGLAMMSADIIAEKLEASRSPDLAIKALGLTTQALGYGARQERVAVQNNFVVALPEKMTSPEAWAQAHRGVQATIVDVTEVPSPVPEISK